MVGIPAHRLPCVLSLVVLVSIGAATIAAAQAPCEVPDNGTGTADLPPPGCGYVSPQDLHVIIDGLPPGTEIHIDPVHEEFFNTNSAPGGNLGGEVETFDSILTMQMTGTGDLAGFNRFISIQLAAITHTGPRNPGDPVQTFPNDMFRLEGELFGDPDFDFLRIEGGTSFGLPSPGQTELTKLPTGNFNVDSFFDVTYRIEFQGAPGSILEGMAGTTTDTVRMQAGVEAPGIPPCIVEDNGTGTVDLPPPGCGYVSPEEFHVILDGVPAGTQINIAPEHRRFIQVTTQPGGNLGGEVENFDSEIELRMTGTGDLAGFQRTIVLPLAAETHTGPRNPGDPVQTFPNDMFSLQGELFGDPDFDELRIRAGTGFGLPSPGETTLTRLGDSHWNVDSFFDVFYEIDFVGAPGSALEGMGGTTQSSVRMQAGGPACDPIPEGDDVFPSTAKIVLQLADGTDPFVVRLSSADLPDTIVHRFPQVGDEIPVEIVQLELSGFHPRVGPIQVHLDPTQPSTGEIRNVIQDPTTCELISGDSFFDVIVDIELPALGQTWGPDRPIHLERKLRRLPPEDVKYENPFLDPITLIDNATGGQQGQLLYHLHHTDPPFPPGPECFDTFMELVASIPPFPPTILQAQGPTTVQVGTPVSVGTCDISGTACTTDDDCPLGEICVRFQNQVQTELVEMQLEGFDPFLGGFEVRVRPPDAGPPSAGQMISQNPGHGTYTVDSFFDVFVDVNLFDQGLLLHNEQPVPVFAGPNGPSFGVRNVPPDPQTPFESPPGQPFVLFTEDNAPVGEISDVRHIIDVPRDWFPPPPPDEDCFESWVHLRVTIFTPFCEDELWLHGHFRVLRDAVRDSDGNGIPDVIDTLMAKAQFEGQSDCLGSLTTRLNRNSPSAGGVSRLTPEEYFPADSFFDVFVEVDSGIGSLFTQDPSHMTTTINSLPPELGEIYFGPGTVIPLYQGICTLSGFSCQSDADCPDAGDTCTIVQIGEIEEVSHEIHEVVDCPTDCKSGLMFTSPTNKAQIDVGIPGGGAGVQYDVVRGDLNVLHGTNGSFISAVLIQVNGPPVLFDFTTPTLPGQGFYYVARDGFGAYNGTWNSGGAGQVADRDPLLP
jgi:hypothetical protein